MLGVRDLVLDPHYTSITEDCCLCQVDVEATARLLGWKCETGSDTFDVHLTPPA